MKAPIARKALIAIKAIITSVRKGNHMRSPLGGPWGGPMGDACLGLGESGDPCPEPSREKPSFHPGVRRNEGSRNEGSPRNC